MQGLAESVAPVGRIQVGPEHRQERVSAVEPEGPGSREVREEHQVFRTSLNALHGRAFGCSEVESSERLQVEHRCSGGDRSRACKGQVRLMRHPTTRFGHSGRVTLFDEEGVACSQASTQRFYRRSF